MNRIMNHRDCDQQLLFGILERA